MGGGGFINRGPIMDPLPLKASLWLKISSIDPPALREWPLTQKSGASQIKPFRFHWGRDPPAVTHCLCGNLRESISRPDRQRPPCSPPPPAVILTNLPAAHARCCSVPASGRSGPQKHV